MIKYLELTAPEESRFRQAKIVSVVVNEGDEVNAGDALFKVLSGSSEIDLPARLSGRVVEIIVDEGENISLMTPLLLLETEVEKSTASKPISDDADVTAAEKEPSANEEPSAEKEPSANEEPSADKKPLANEEPSAEKDPATVKQSSAEAEASSDDLNEKKAKTKSNKKNDAKKKKQKKSKKKQAAAKRHTQQSLNLDGEEEPEFELVPPEDDNIPQQVEQTASSDMSENKILVPDIGIDSAKVIEILVSVGDSVAVDDPLVTLESDKASMDVPATIAGTIESIEVSMDQDVAEGDLIVTVVASDNSASAQSVEPETQQSEPADEVADSTVSEQQSTPTTSDSGGAIVEVTIPDIGGDSAKVIEIFVAVGQAIDVDEPLVTLESDKASMDVPSTVAGKILSIDIAMDQDVSEGTLVVTVATENNDDKAPAESAKTESAQTAPAAAPPAPAKTAATPSPASQTVTSNDKSHASPSVRRFARELGADLSRVNGTGRKNRITKDDVKQFVKGVMAGGTASAAASGAGIPEVPAVDFSKFGEIDVQPLNKIKKLTAANLHRSWLNVPHVTHNDESNISDLESFRKQLNEEYKKQGKETKLSPLAFIVKAVVNALQTYPQFNASLEPGGENLIYKKYFHIGIAVDTPNGLVVPVVRDADKKSVAEIAQEMGELAGKARDKKLMPADMSGACFTISSLGGIGGTGFTPIVNAPEVAILGVSRSKMQPVWDGSDFKPGMILPLSLSYDHRVIDGAEAARFTRQIAAVLEDVRRLAV